MDEADKRLLAALLSRQRETGTAAELPPERLRAAAEGGAPLDPREAAALLASPVAREEYALHRRLARLRRAAAAHDARRVFRAPAEARLAAAGGGAAARGAFRLACGDAELWVAPGRTAASRFLLTVRLSPAVEGGAAGRAVEVREEGPDGLVWVAGRTDAEGAVHRFWEHEEATPHARRGTGAPLRLFVLG